MFINLRKLRFKTDTITYINSPLRYNELKVIISIIKKDKLSFKIANAILSENPSNDGSSVGVISRFDLLKEVFILDDEELSINNNDLNNMRTALSNLFDKNKVSTNKYKEIRNAYIEYITMIWKCYAGHHSKVFFEPEIWHGKKLLFSNSGYEKSRIDVVHIIRKLKRLEAYECKTTMICFFYHLKQQNSNPSNKAVRRAVNKYNYLKNMKNIRFSTHSNAVAPNVGFVTLANIDEFSNEQLQLISDVRLYTREDLESDYEIIRNNI